MTLRVYVAAPLAEARAARDWADTLRSCGHDITSSWHDVVEDGECDPLAEHLRSEILAVNTRDLEGAQVVFAVLRTGTPRATYAEIGYAIALGKRVVWMHGARTINTNIFDAHPLSYSTHSGSDAIAWLARLDVSLRPGLAKCGGIGSLAVAK